MYKKPLTIITCLDKAEVRIFSQQFLSNSWLYEHIHIIVLFKPSAENAAEEIQIYLTIYMFHLTIKLAENRLQQKIAVQCITPDN